MKETEINFDDGHTEGYIGFTQGILDFNAHSGYTEQESHGAELTKAQTEKLYLAMKDYYENVDISTKIGRAINREGFQGGNN